MSESEIRSAVAREDVFRFIAACYYQPEPAFAEEGVFASLVEAVGLVQPNLVPLAQALGEEFTRSDPADLLLDYTRLFLGPNLIAAKPYGSAWLEDQKTLMGESTVAVLELYKEGGFDIDDAFRELPDHIAVELEFLYLLIFRENEAQFERDTERMQAMAELKRRFLEQHLGRWVTPFARAVREGAQSNFYRHLGELTESVVNSELALTACRA